MAYQAGGAGRYVVIRHGREYQTVYMHLSRALVSAGQTVKKGERIALTGNTGDFNWSTLALRVSY